MNEFLTDDIECVSTLNGQSVYLIDGIRTIINSVHKNVAKGVVVNDDSSMTDCYVVRIGNYFAHGTTPREAWKDALKKSFLEYPVEDRIKKIIEKYPDLDKKIQHRELFALHNSLTGSCRFGREHFAKEHNINTETGEMSMREFIKITKDAYFGGDIIKQLAKEYGI